MVDITPPVPAGRQYIQAYGDGGFRVSGERHVGSILVLPERTLPWAATSTAEFSADSLSPVREAQDGIEILLIGCGRQMAFIAPALRQAVRDWGAVIDAMDTGAACRTYNVLLTEDRRVAAALLPVA